MVGDLWAPRGPAENSGGATIHDRDDACPVYPFAAVPGEMARFSRVPRKELIAVSGGSEPLSRHGYIGIEDEAVAKIAAWIKGS